MSAGFTFSACSFFYSVLLTIMFFSKKRIQTLENKIYSYLIISNLVGVVLGVSCYTSILHRDAFPILNDFISKALLIYYLTWISFFTAYTFVISYSKKESDKESKEKYFKNIFNYIKTKDNITKFALEDSSLEEIFIAKVGEVYGK